MARHEDEIALAGQGDQLLRLLDLGDEGLFDQDVLAGLERHPGEGIVSVDRRGDHHRVQVRVSQDCLGLGINPQPGVEIGNVPQALLRSIGRSRHLRAQTTERREDADVVRAPVAAADDTDSDRTGQHPSDQ